MPARDRQNEFQPRLIGHSGGGEVLLLAEQHQHGLKYHAFGLKAYLKEMTPEDMGVVEPEPGKDVEPSMVAMADEDMEEKDTQTCSECRGSGKASDGSPCEYCEGTGRVLGDPELSKDDEEAVPEEKSWEDQPADPALLQRWKTIQSRLKSERIGVGQGKN